MTGEEADREASIMEGCCTPRLRAKLDVTGGDRKGAEAEA